MYCTFSGLGMCIFHALIRLLSNYSYFEATFPYVLLCLHEFSLVFLFSQTVRKDDPMCNGDHQNKRYKAGEMMDRWMTGWMDDAIDHTTNQLDRCGLISHTVKGGSMTCCLFVWEYGEERNRGVHSLCLDALVSFCCWLKLIYYNLQ